jgi:hypothetical protein
MGLEMKVKRAVLEEQASKYRNCSKKGKRRVLGEFMNLAGYNRCYACGKLSIILCMFIELEVKELSDLY